MQRRNLYQAGRVVVASFIAVFVLTACGALKFASPYDEQIVDGLTKYNQEVVTFVEEMTAKNGTEAGTYKKNEDFYFKQTGVVDSLILRAEAQDPRTGCLVSGKAVDLLGDRLPSDLKPEQVEQGDSKEGCTVRMLRNVKKELGKLSALHQVEKPNKQGVMMSGFRKAEAQSILAANSTAIRAVLAAELLKKGD